MDYIKGFLIGIAKVIPGVSGALLAISLGIYEKCINIISDFSIKKNFYFLFKLGIGFIIGVYFASKVVIYLLNNYYLPIMLLFIGLILGTFKSVFSNIKKINIFFYLSFVLIMLISLINTESFFTHSGNILTSLLLGFIDAFTMVIPGISGTAIMMLLGCYSTYMDMIINININMFIYFILSLALSIFIISKLINYFLKKHSNSTYNIIIGLSVSSIFILLIDCIKNANSILEFAIGIILFILAFSSSFLLSK